MNCANLKLVTPIYLKTENDMPWPEEKNAFYLVSKEGLFFCRNSRFFKSCVPARGGPCELANQEAFLELQYPMIPQDLVELAVGFFDGIFNCIDRCIKRNNIADFEESGLHNNVNSRPQAYLLCKRDGIDNVKF